ncbi:MULTISPECIES: TetR family transcriptional regulator [Saccharothrix]|uniref:TetR family transcriptional regulator n=1 Tax=Saccharothrix TaxID=2071 RepID=UPI0009F8C230|nr:TetR family transcriptional regulator [Saccharothrix sp. CB00851]
MTRGRVTREDWMMAALRALARGGVAAVAVDALAGELDITRGSFYWHSAGWCACSSHGRRRTWSPGRAR